MDKKGCSFLAQGKYRIHYKKGLNEAVPGTLGIFIFKTKHHAEDFRKDCECTPSEVILQKCYYDPELAKIVDKIGDWHEFDLDYYYNFGCGKYCAHAPFGSLCVPWIEIPDEVV